MMNPMQILSMLQQLQQNPAQLLAQRFNVPGNLSDPQAIIQHLLNSGQVSQDQVNQAMQMQNNTFFQQLLGKK